MGKGQGNAAKHNVMGQKVVDGGKGGKKNDQGFGDDLSRATGSAGMGTPAKSARENTPDGQVIK